MRRPFSRKGLQDACEQLREFGEIFDVSFHAADKKPAGEAEDVTGDLIELLIETRQRLREKKDWQLADKIRARLNELNIVIEDA
jgi:cysteinyl-tRNA synthetase